MEWMTSEKPVTESSDSTYMYTDIKTKPLVPTYCHLLRS